MDLSLQEYVKGHGYELLFYDNRGTDKEAFANHDCKVIGIGSYLDDHEKRKQYIMKSVIKSIPADSMN